MSVKETSIRKIVTFNEEQNKKIKDVATFFDVSEASIIRLATETFLYNIKKLLDWKAGEESSKGYL